MATRQNFFFTKRCKTRVSSGLLFVLAGEPLAHQIQINESIKGLENGNKMTKLSLYADDTTAFIRDSSAASLFTLLDQFGDLSGLKINKSKTEGLWLGSWKSRLGKDEPFGILWPKQYVTALGIVFPYNVHVGNKINFDEQLAKLKNALKYLVKQTFNDLRQDSHCQKSSTCQTCL